MNKLPWHTFRGQALATGVSGLRYEIDKLFSSQHNETLYYLTVYDGGMRKRYPGDATRAQAKTRAQRLENNHGEIKSNPVKRKNPVMDYPDGSFVIHSLTGAYKGKVSAYYGANGGLQDAEQILPGGKTRAIKRGGAMWESLKKIGVREFNAKNNLKSNPIKHKNPSTVKTALKIDAAKALRAGFRATAGGAAGQTGSVKEITQRKRDHVQMAVGVIECIEYTVLNHAGRRITGQSFRHEFSGKSCPTLTVSHDGNQLYIVGGKYKFKTDGINDLK